MSTLTVPIVLKELRELYQPPKSFLDHRNPLELLIATVLSAQCTDRLVNIVTKTLFAKYRSPQDYLDVSLAELESDIRSITFAHAKAGYLQGLCRLLLERHHGEVPRTMEELVALPGVGRKTASIVLHVAFDVTEGIAVDTHVLRLSKRLGLTMHSDQKRVELDLMQATPRESWGELNPLLISHGRAVCTARNRKCDQCVFQRRCPSSWVMKREDLARPEPAAQ